MSYALGIDVGTTYTAAAVVRDGRAEVATLGYRATSVPTVELLTPRRRRGREQLHLNPHATWRPATHHLSAAPTGGNPVGRPGVYVG
jgi:molecular chaperone DnaK (HSP70)